jgi:predicted O-methyltransferase YrrM
MDAEAAPPQGDHAERVELELTRRQLWSDQQEAVLRALGELAAGDRCRFLEIGSWCGDSALVLGAAARARGGQLVCVDWWRGSPGTDLAAVAGRHDVYGYFWRRVCAAGLDRTVVPVRGASQEVAGALCPEAFDLVFIDGDHRYGPTAEDIRLYRPLVRPGGVICGHDCEGRPGDYAPDFLAAGRDVNYHEAVHCGVVLAVGEAFDEVAICQGIWSARRSADGSAWRATPMPPPGVADRRQPPPPPFAVTPTYRISRYGRRVYAVPRAVEPFDLTDRAVREHRRAVAAPTLAALERAIGERAKPFQPPRLLAAYRGFNLVRYGGRVVALSQELGSVDLSAEPAERIDALRRRGLCFEADSPADAVRRLDAEVAARRIRPPRPRLLEMRYGHNFVAYAGKVYAAAQALGPQDLAAVPPERMARLVARGEVFCAASLADARRAVLEAQAAALRRLRGSFWVRLGRKLRLLPKA